MGDVLIRGLFGGRRGAHRCRRRRARGLSRQVYLRQRFEREGTVSPAQRTMTLDDLRRAAAAAADLDDPAVMESAWR
jgi:hypothetical protein